MQNNENKICDSSDCKKFTADLLNNFVDKDSIVLDIGTRYADLDGDLKLDKVDIIKIYNDGYDINVLHGLKNIISKNPSLKLFVEFNPKHLQAISHQTEDLFCWLDSMGFDIFLIKDKERQLFKLKNFAIDWHLLSEKDECANLLCLHKTNSHYSMFFSHEAGKSGAVRALLDLIQLLSKAGHLCHVVIPAHGDFEAEIKKLPVSYNIQPFSWSLINCNDFNNHLVSVGNELYQALPFIAKIGPDVIYTNTCVINLGAVIAHLLEIPHVWHIREFGELDHQLKFYEGFENRVKFINQHSDFIIFDSKAVQKYYSQYIDIHKSKVIYNKVLISQPTEHTPIFTRKSAYKILVLANIQKGKGQIDVVRSANDLVQSKENFEVIFVGPICEKEYFEELNSELVESCRDKVKFIGYIDNPSNAITEADVLVVPSLNEAFGRVLIEGMAFKKAIIATNSGGIPEFIIDGETGFLYPPGDVNALKNIILNLWHKPNIREYIGINAFNHYIKNYKNNNYVEHVSAILKSVIKNHSKDSVIRDYTRCFISDLNQKIRSYEATIANQEQHIRDQKQCIKDQGQHIREICLTISWRITKPLRFTKRKIIRFMLLLRRLILIKG